MRSGLGFHKLAVSGLKALVFALTAAPLIAAQTFPVNITIDASQTKGELKPIWRFFGADEPNFAYMKDGQKLIKELGELRRGMFICALTTYSLRETGRRH